MISSRCLYAAMMLFWVFFLGLLAIMVRTAPQAGMDLSGLTFFSATHLVDTFVISMIKIGLSDMSKSFVLAFVVGFNFIAAGLLLYATVFWLFGEEPEQIEAFLLSKAALVCLAIIGMVMLAISFAAGQLGALAEFELAALCAVCLTLACLARPIAQMAQQMAKTDPGQSRAFEKVLSDHATSHALLSAQLVTLADRGART